jgi:ankyrin repeat protein
VVQLLVLNGADLTKVKKKDGTTCLHIAAGTNDIHLMDFIIKNLPNKKEFINRKNFEGWIPAHIAAFLNNFDSLNLLLENGADLITKNDSGMTPIDEIIRNDHKDLLSCVYEKIRFVKRDLALPGSFSVMHLAAG